MSTEVSKAQDVVTAASIARPRSDGGVKAGGVFTVVCCDEDGNFKWTDTFHNLVVNQALQDMNVKYFSGVGYTAAWYLGLINGPGASNTYAAVDTLASHVGWVENTSYTGTRKQAVFGSATTADPSVIDNSGAPAVFNIVGGSQAIGGAFLTSVASGTSGILFSANNFSGGDKLVSGGDTLTVTYTFSLDAA